MSIKVKVESTFRPPLDINFIGVHGYLEAPDASYGPPLVVDNSAVSSKIISGNVIDLGVIYNTVVDSNGNVSVFFNTDLLNFPIKTENWRLYLQSVGKDYDPPLVLANQTNPTPSIVFSVNPSDNGGIGTEYAPLVKGISADSRGFQLISTINKASASSSGWNENFVVTWTDPTIQDNPDTIQNFTGVVIEVLKMPSFYDPFAPVGPEGFKDPLGFENAFVLSSVVGRYPVNAGVQQWTSTLFPVLDPQATFVFRVLSVGVNGTNTFSPIITPQGWTNSLNLQELIKNGGPGTLPLSDADNFSVNTYYDYGEDASFDFIIQPSFNFPQDQMLNNFGFVLEKPAGSGNFSLLDGRPSIGDGYSDSDKLYLQRSQFPTQVENWKGVLVSFDINGNAKYVDAEYLPTGLVGPTPNFGTSPTFTFPVAPQAAPVGSGIEYADLVTNVGSNSGNGSNPIYYAKNIDGVWGFGFAGVCDFPTDPRFQNCALMVLYAGNPVSSAIEVDRRTKDQDPTFKTDTYDLRPSSGTMYFVSSDGSRDNTIVPGITPGIGFSVSTQVGSINMGRGDPATQGPGIHTNSSGQLAVRTGASTINTDSSGNIIAILDGTTLTATSGGVAVNLDRLSLDVVSGAVAVKSVDLAKALNFNSAEFKLVSGQFLVNGIDLSKAISSTLSSELAVTAGVFGVAYVGATKIAAGTLAAGVVYAGTVVASQIISGNISASVGYLGTLNASQVNAGLFTGTSLQLSLNGATGFFSNDLDPSGGAGVRVQDNTTGEHSMVTQNGFRLYPSSGNSTSLIDLSSPAPTYAPQLKLANPTVSTIMVLRPNNLSFGGQQVLSSRVSTSFTVSTNTAAGTYGSNEAGMLNAAYNGIGILFNALRTHGIIS